MAAVLGPKGRCTICLLLNNRRRIPAKLFESFAASIGTRDLVIVRSACGTSRYNLLLGKEVYGMIV